MINEYNDILISPQLRDCPTINPSIKLGILASGKGSNFEQILKCCKSQLNAKVIHLITNNEDCGAVYIAKKYNIPYSILDHKKFNTREEYDRSIIKIFRDNGIEIIVMAGWMRIVTSLLINEFSKRIINIHPSLLPSFKGTNSVEQALENNVKITGCTAHIVEEEVDSGKILIQGAVTIDESDDKYSLQKKIQHVEHMILYKAVAIAASEWRENCYG